MEAATGKSYLSDEEQAVLEKVCHDVGVPTELVVALIEAEWRLRYGPSSQYP